MLQALLEDRFKLKVHRQTREATVYALTVAKGDPKLQPFKEGSCIPADLDHSLPPPVPGHPLPQLCGMFHGTNNGFDVHGETMADFCAFLSTSVQLDRQVIDKTGIAGMFDIHLDLYLADLGHPGPGLSDPAAPATATDQGDIFTAAKSAVKKLGLNLEPTKGPGEFLVIDHIERPSEN